MGEDEAGTLAALKSLRRELVKPKEIQYGDRTVKLMGDGVFPANSGGAQVARTDLAFFAEAGQIEGLADPLKVEDFGYLEPLNKALAKLGTVGVDYAAP
jgi:NitT/TauT family transport system substrate-binding protein